MSEVHPRPVRHGVSGSWRTFALRGLAAVLFGLLIIIWPGLALFTLPLLIVLLGAYILIDGIVTIVAGTRTSGIRNKWALLVEGTLGVLAGVVAIARPGLAGLAIIYVVAAWAVLSGISKLASSIWYRRQIEHAGLMAASGVVTVIFGIVLAVLPGAGLPAFVWVTGIYAMTIGIMFLIYSYWLRLRELQRSESGRPT